MKNDSRKPFENLLSVAEKFDPENIEMLDGYNTAYRQLFLPYFKTELKQILTAKNPKAEVPTLVSVRTNLQTVTNIHTNPKKHLSDTYKTVMPKIRT